MKALAAALIVATVTASARQPQQPPPVFRAGADIVEIDVVVHGRNGAFVSDLSVDDFIIEEGGRPQEILQFFLHTTSNASPRVLDTAPAQTAGRVLVVVFDDAHLTPGGFKRTQAAAQTLFSQQFRHGDIGGVITRGRMVKDRLTSDRDELLKAINDAKPDFRKGSRLLLEREWPRLSEIEAVRVAVNNDRNVLEEAMRRACADDPDQCRRADPEAQVRSKAAQLADAARAESTRTLQMMRVLASGLANIGGRKTILLMSEGFVAEESWSLVQETVALAARANARIYTLDARGLDRGTRSIIDVSPGADDASARMLEQMDFGADSVNSLAVDTGGFVVRNTNQFDRAIARIADDASNYYVLGYRALAEPDGTFHRITVKVKRPGVAARARRGYVATPRKLTTTAPTAAHAPEEVVVAPAGGAVRTEPIPDPAPAEAAVVPRAENAVGFRLRPDANAHAKTLAGATAERDADASAGWEAYQRGDVETARAKLAAAAQRPDADAWVHFTLGMSDYALRQYREAAGSWERVRVSAPDFEPVYFDLVDAYLQMKEYDHATRVAREAMDRWPRDPEIINALGVVQTVRGALDDAIRSFQSAVAISPQDATGHFNLGKAMELRYYRSRRYVQQLRSWVSNEKDRMAAMDQYQRYLDLGGAYAEAARAGLDRLKWIPEKK